MAPHRENSHCSSCGAAHPPDAGWPRTCRACGHTAYRNPLPVAVALLPVRSGRGGHDASGGPEGTTGLVVVRRAIEPRSGLLALPGGFIDHDESWQQAVVRELEEETGIRASADDVRLADALSSPGGHLLLFGLLPPCDADTLPPFAPTGETEDRQVLSAPAELAFPLHTRAAATWFAGGYSAAAAPRTRTG